ncbi:unnamed protein product [Natator depressus]
MAQNTAAYLLSSLHWLLFAFMVLSKVAKALNGLGPNYLRDCHCLLCSIAAATALLFPGSPIHTAFSGGVGGGGGLSSAVVPRFVPPLVQGKPLAGRTSLFTCRVRRFGRSQLPVATVRCSRPMGAAGICSSGDRSLFLSLLFD